ncbi:MAG: response regulator [Phycisphaerales bacterium]
MNNIRILIVDDEPAISAVIALKLRHAGYTPVCAQDAEEAVREVRRQTFALAIIDLHLPRVSGLQLCGRLLAEKRGLRVPVLVITGAAAAAPEVMTFSNIRGIIAKPFSPRDLIDRVRAVIGEVPVDADA